jgi:hypothetical protein
VNVTISPQLRLVAVLGLAAAAVLMGGLYFMTRAQLAAQDEATPAPVVHRPAPTASTPKAAAKPQATAADTTKPKTAKPSATPTVKKPAVRPTLAMKLAVQHRLPFSIARALIEHRVVVAALVIPDASLDTTVVAEARSAAEEAGVGFVTVNVLRQRAGRALAERLGVVETPAVIVYRRPAKAFIKLEGFADRDMVAQAVANAFGR